MKLSHEELQRRAEAYREHGTLVKAAAALGIKKSAFHESIKRAAEIGLLGPSPTLPGYAIKSLRQASTKPISIAMNFATGKLQGISLGEGDLESFHYAALLNRSTG
ncbi:hypothetical protein [Brucella oryzae]|uniref:hypothetical protein n=1 Tax=Brucella oryzae TaxID=335286 RepID=UPI002012A54C|nr:hypothetical protein [Brucella oryzae]